MTPIGHSLTGLAIGAVVLPREWSVGSKVLSLAAFVVLANVPDLPLPGWGHQRYHVSHSALVTSLGVAFVAAAAMVTFRGSWRVPLATIFAGGAAWFSHLLLDTFYNHGKGLAIYWPASDGRLALPVPWFSTMQLDPLFSWHNAQVFAIEGLAYGTLLTAALVWRRRRSALPPEGA